MSVLMVWYSEVGMLFGKFLLDLSSSSQIKMQLFRLSKKSQKTWKKENFILACDVVKISTNETKLLFISGRPKLKFRPQFRPKLPVSAKFQFRPKPKKVSAETNGFGQVTVSAKTKKSFGRNFSTL